MEGKSELNKSGEIGLKSSVSILVESFHQLIAECFSPLNNFIVQTKTKPFRSFQNHCFKQFERCDYKTTCRPSIQLFKTNYKCVKKSEENIITQGSKKFSKTNKATNKYLSFGSADSESLKNYRDFHVYKSLGSVARKNLETAIAIYNANREEIEVTRRSSNRKNGISYKREQTNQKKENKVEQCIRTTKPKIDNKDKLSKEFKYVSQKKQEEDTIKMHKCLKDIEDASKVNKTQIKKFFIKNDFKQCLPKLKVRPIERKIKEKKQLRVSVLNLSLPLINQNQKCTKTQSTLKKIRNDHYQSESYSNINMFGDEDDNDLQSFRNKNKILNEYNEELYISRKYRTPSINRRGYLLKLPVQETNKKRLNINSGTNLCWLTYQEPEQSYKDSPKTNDLDATMPKQISRKPRCYRLIENTKSTSYNQIEDTTPKSKTNINLNDKIIPEKGKNVENCNTFDPFCRNKYQSKNKNGCNNTLWNSLLDAERTFYVPEINKYGNRWTAKESEEQKIVDTPFLLKNMQEGIESFLKKQN